MVIAEHWETAAVAEGGNLAEGVIVHILWHGYERGIGLADAEVIVDIAEPPFICLFEGRERVINNNNNNTHIYYNNKQ